MSRASQSGGLSARPGRRRRGAFTLTELVVSIGIMVLMITMAGTIFKVTTDSTGQANAVIKISDSLRLLEQTLRDDLRNVPRGGAILVIQSQPVNAFWTRDDIDANPDGTDPMDPSGTPYVHLSDPEREVPDPTTGQQYKELPRADILMTFTAQPGTSYLSPDVSSEFQQVVYGHAEVGELDSTTETWTVGAPNDFGTDGAFPSLGDVFPGTGRPPRPAENWHLARRCVLLVDGSVTTGAVGTLAAPDLWDGIADVVSPGDFQAADLVPEWFRRSRLDLRPPTRAASRLGHYFIPRCASFKVEWAIDLWKLGSVPFNPAPGNADSAPQELVWFDPGRGAFDSAGKWQPDPFGELVELAARYNDVGATAVANALASAKTELMSYFKDWALSPPDVTGAQWPVWYSDDPYWPDALRITVDLFDPAGKLKRPIRHVMVIPVGG